MQTVCEGCKATSGLQGVVVYDFRVGNLPEEGWRLALYCPECVIKYELFCEGHRLPKVSAENLLLDGLDDEDASGIFACCRSCVYEVVRAMPLKRRDSLLHLAKARSDEDAFIEIAECVADQRFAHMDREQRILYGLLMFAALNGMEPERFFTSCVL